MRDENITIQFLFDKKSIIQDVFIKDSNATGIKNSCFETFSYLRT